MVSKTLYRYQAAITGLIVFLSVAILTQYATYQKYSISVEAEKQKVFNEIIEVTARINTCLANSRAATKTLAFLVNQFGPPTNFDSTAKSILASNPTLDALLLTNKGVITHVFPFKSNEPALGFDILKNPSTAKEANIAIQKNDLYFAGPFKLKQGGMGIVGRLPIFKNENFIGFSIVIIKLSNLFKNAKIDHVNNRNFYYKLAKINPTTNQMNYFLPDNRINDVGVTQSLIIPDGNWILYVSLKKSNNFIIYILISFLGLFFSTVSGGFVWYLAKKPEELNRVVLEKNLQIREEEKYYSSLIEKSADAIFLVDNEKRIFFQSNAGKRILGYEDLDLYSTNLESILHPSDRATFGNFFDEVSKCPGKTIQVIQQIKTKNNIFVWLDCSYTNYLQDQVIQGIVLNFHDITLRIQAEEKVKNANRLYELISKINQLIVLISNETLLLQEVCKVALEFGGFTMVWIGIVDDDGKNIKVIAQEGTASKLFLNAKHIEILQDKVKNGMSVRAFISNETIYFNDIENSPDLKTWQNYANEFGFKSAIAVPIKKFGKTIGVFSIYANAINFFDSKEIALVESVTWDISIALENFEKDRKRLDAEKQLLSVYKEKVTTLNRITDCVISLDRDWRYTFLNLAALKSHSKKSSEELLGQVIWDENPGMKNTSFWNLYNDALNNGEDVESEEYYPLTKNWFYIKIYPSNNGLTIFYRDITERKKTEQTLNENRIFIESIINASPDIIYIYDLIHSKFIYFNDGIQKNLGFTKEEFLQMGDNPLQKLIHEDDFNKYLEITIPKYATIGDKEIIESEYRIKNSKGQWVWMYCKESIFLRCSEGNPIQIFGISTDISYRIESEKKLLDISKEKETTLNRISDGLISVDNHWRFTFINDVALTNYFQNKNDLLRKTLWEVSPILIGGSIEPKLREAMDKKQLLNIENYLAATNIWLSVKIYPSEDGLTFFIKNISKEKEAQNTIELERIFSESIINSLPGIFYLYDKNGVFIRWNQNFEMITGYSSNEIKQMHPLNFFQKEEETLLKDVIEKVFVLGTGEVSAHLYTKEKKIIPYYFNGNKATINQKDYLIGMGLDISKQVESDNNLKERAEQIQILTAHLQLIREEERTRIAREIHDELGQQLTGLKMDTSWIGKKIIDNDIVKSKIKEMVVLLDNTIQTVRRISSDLRPGILDDLGLVPALEWQSEEFEKRTGIISEFDGFLLNDNLESNLSTNIFRVHQEALTNVARHSGATKVITKIKEFECNIVLIVHDNGNGFDVDNTKFRNSLGIIGMRERAYLFKGDLYIDSKKLSGTTVKLTVPSSIAVKNL